MTPPRRFGCGYILPDAVALTLATGQLVATRKEKIVPAVRFRNMTVRPQACGHQYYPALPLHHAIHRQQTPPEIPQQIEPQGVRPVGERSEERRVGKECTSR